MNEMAKQMAKYFKEKPEYKRLLNGIKSKYINFGEIKGNVVIKNPDNAEAEALSGLMKKDYSKNKSISINLAVLQKRIDESKFYGAELKDIIFEYFKEEITTKKENKNSYENQLSEYFKEIVEQNKNTKIYNTLKEIVESKNQIYYKLKKYYNKNKEELRTALINASKGINELPKSRTRIPVYASNITGNPHGFDRNTLCGKLFITLICYMEKIQYPNNTEELAEIYYNNNLLIDDVSNMVLCKNVLGFIKNNKEQYIEHQGLQGFYQNHEPIYLNLFNLSNIESLAKPSKYKEVIVMENPTVFMEVSEKCNKKDFPLVCTYGQVKLSGLILLDMFVKKGYKICYSGDLDPEGIQIADKLKQRYKNNLKFFGFDVDTYNKKLSNVYLSETRIKKLNGIKSFELLKICDKIRASKKASYEEENIDNIIKYINSKYNK